MARNSIIALLIASLAYFSYWAVGSSAQQNILEAWLDDREKDGWVAEYKSLDVNGFPNRFDTSIVDLELADPSSGWAWSAPKFEILSLSYKPNHVIAVWPPLQMVSTPEQNISVASKDMRASVKFDADTDLALNATTLDMQGVTLTSNQGWVSTFKSAKLATRQTADVALSHDIFFEATDFKPANILKSFTKTNAQMPDVFETMRIDVVAGFDDTWDRHAVEGHKPEITKLDVKDVTALWGSMELQANGALTFDSNGSPIGDLDVRAKNWRDMIKVATQAGVIAPELNSTIESVLGLMARMTGNPDTIDVPLSFSGGLIKLGPIPIGEAPRFKLNKS